MHGCCISHSVSHDLMCQIAGQPVHTCVGGLFHPAMTTRASSIKGGRVLSDHSRQQSSPSLHMCMQSYIMLGYLDVYSSMADTHNTLCVVIYCHGFDVQSCLVVLLC